MKNVLVPVVNGIVLFMSLLHTISAQWVQTSGPDGGGIRALAASGGTIFAGL